MFPIPYSSNNISQYTKAKAVISDHLARTIKSRLLTANGRCKVKMFGLGQSSCSFSSSPSESDRTSSLTLPLAWICLTSILYINTHQYT
nr:hypothetical protein Iba_chr08bCG12210 [Ipomoea batatas]GMD28600.1 hypothetical protein Iba_chr08eCG8860 [Ipomoea batatas]